MNIVLALFFLGLIQGLTEFLPVSSSGHLVLFSSIFGIEDNLFLSILLHVATLLSILVVFHKDIWQMARHPFSKQTLMLAVATIPTCLVVLVLMPFVKAAFMGQALSVCFVLTAFILLLSEKLSKKKNNGYFNVKTSSIDFKTAFLMGVAQGFAVFPGISRSGSTISAGLLQGKDREEVAKFSFLMSVPIILLSLLMEVYEIATTTQVISLPVIPTILSFLTAFIVGIFAIKLMLKLTNNCKLKWFSFYLAVISIISLFVLNF